MTPQDKQHLQELKKHPWFLVLKRLEEEFVTDFNRKIMQDESFDISKPETQKKIQEASMYIRARKWVFDLVNVNTLWIARPKV